MCLRISLKRSLLPYHLLGMQDFPRGSSTCGTPSVIKNLYECSEFFPAYLMRKTALSGIINICITAYTRLWIKGSLQHTDFSHMNDHKINV